MWDVFFTTFRRKKKEKIYLQKFDSKSYQKLPTRRSHILRVTAHRSSPLNLAFSFYFKQGTMGYIFIKLFCLSIVARKSIGTMEARLHSFCVAQYNIHMDGELHRCSSTAVSVAEGVTNRVDRKCSKTRCWSWKLTNVCMCVYIHINALSTYYTYKRT